MDYEKKYNEALERAKRLRDSFYQTMNAKRVVEEIFPELADSKDEMIRKWLVVYFGSIKEEVWIHRDITCEQILAWLEKQKESLHIPETCKEKADSFTSDIIEVRSFQRGMEEGRRLEKQKEQKSDIILKAFENSKTDYSLEEREEASDYSEKVLPTSITYGENEDEYRLHKIIEAAYIAGQKEQKPAECADDVVEEAEEYTSKVACGEYGVEVTEAYIAGVVSERNRGTEWSEEDKDKLYRIIETLLGDREAARQENPKHYDVLCKAYEELISWLKSLRPSWKPSEEEVGCLERLIAFKNPEPEDINGCKSLLEQLTKLI